MPHRKEHMKQTGDTHPPEVEDETGREEEAAARFAAGGEQPQDSRSAASAQQRNQGEPSSGSASEGFRLDAKTERYLDAARAEVRRKPLAYAAGAFAIGFLLAVITRS